MKKKTSSKNKSLLNWLKKIRVEDLLLIVVGILVFMIIITVTHYSYPGEELPKQALSGASIRYYFDVFVKGTTFKYVFFVLVPLLVVWVAKLFQKKTWNIKKSLLWVGIGVVIMLLVYFSSPSKTGLENIPASETPDVKMFVMTFCPFGQKAEEALKPVQDLFGDKVSIEPHFIINDLSDRENQRSGCLKNNTLCSLHGINELNEDIRQMCIWKYNPDKWWDYVLCINNGCTIDDVETCWKTCAENNEISVAKIRACQELEGIGLAEKDRDLSEELKAYSSPTIIINNAQYTPDRIEPEPYKRAICKGFKKPPAECEAKLGDDTEITADSVKKKKESLIIKKEVNKNKSTEEGVCSQTGEKVEIILTQGEGE